MTDIFVTFPTIHEETMFASIVALSFGAPILSTEEVEAPYVTENNAGFIIDYNLDEAVEKLLLIAKNLDFYSLLHLILETKYL